MCHVRACVAVVWVCVGVILLDVSLSVGMQ